MKIKILKNLIIYILNIGMGYFSMRYFFISITIAGNINGPGYKDSEAESLKFIGFIMLLFGIILISIINIILIKIFMGNIEENLKLFSQKRFQWKNFILHYFLIIISIIIGSILRFVILYHDYEIT